MSFFVVFLHFKISPYPHANGSIDKPNQSKNDDDRQHKRAPEAINQKDNYVRRRRRNHQLQQKRNKQKNTKTKKNKNNTRRRKIVFSTD